MYEGHICRPMCVPVCVFVRVCMNVRTHVYVYVHMCDCGGLRACIYDIVYLYACNVCMYICTYACIHVCMYVCKSMQFMYTCVVKAAFVFLHSIHC